MEMTLSGTYSGTWSYTVAVTVGGGEDPEQAAQEYFDDTVSFSDVRNYGSVDEYSVEVEVDEISEA